MVRSPALRYSKSLWSYNPLPTGCRLYYPLWHPDLGGAVIQSVDLSSTEGTVVEAVKVNLGRDFDGSDDTIALPNDLVTQAEVASGLALAVWFNCELLDAADQFLITIEDRTWIHIEASIDKVQFSIYDGSVQMAESNASIATATWYCAFGSWDSTTLTLYLGTTTTAMVAQTTTDTATVPLFDAASRPSAIGSDRSGGTNYEGIIGEALFWTQSHTLAAAEYFRTRTLGRYL